MDEDQRLSFVERRNCKRFNISTEEGHHTKLLTLLQCSDYAHCRWDYRLVDSDSMARAWAANVHRLMMKSGGLCSQPILWAISCYRGLKYDNEIEKWAFDNELCCIISTLLRPGAPFPAFELPWRRLGGGGLLFDCLMQLWLCAVHTSRTDIMKALIKIFDCFQAPFPDWILDRAYLLPVKWQGVR